MNKGKFIVVEGLEGAGKSSAIKVIEQALKEKILILLRPVKPGGTVLAERLRRNC